VGSPTSAPLQRCRQPWSPMEHPPHLGFPESIPQNRGTRESILSGAVPRGPQGAAPRRGDPAARPPRRRPQPRSPQQAALTVLAAVPDEGGQAAAVGLVALVDGAAAVVQAVVGADLLVAPGPREASGAAAGRHACEQQPSACSSCAAWLPRTGPDPRLAPAASPDGEAAHVPPFWQ